MSEANAADANNGNFEIGRIASLDDSTPLAREMQELIEGIIAREGLQFATLIQTIFSLSNCDSAEFRCYSRLVKHRHLAEDQAKQLLEARMHFMQQMVGITCRAWLGLLDTKYDTDLEATKQFEAFADKIEANLLILTNKQEEYRTISGEKK